MNRLSLKAYISRNVDGRREAMTAATNLINAARIMGTTPFHMRQYGWAKEQGIHGRLAVMNPGVVFIRDICSPGDVPWVPRARIGNSR